MPKFPMPPTNDEAYSKNTKEQYEALGRFVEAFELMVDEVRGICSDSIFSDIFKIARPKPDDWNWEDWIHEEDRQRQLMGLAFHQQSMTAKPLFDVMRAIIAEIVNTLTNFHYPERTMYRDILTHIEKEFSSLY
jgi:hypothetical protein